MNVKSSIIEGVYGKVATSQYAGHTESRFCPDLCHLKKNIVVVNDIYQCLHFVIVLERIVCMQTLISMFI